MEQYVLKNVEETIRFGEVVASCLAPGGCLALVGDLGTGKTHFANGVISRLGYKSKGSPTFSLVHEYEGETLSLAHFDFYRLKKMDELLSIGWDEYVDSEMVLLAEWADVFPELIPPHAIWIQLIHSEYGREVNIKASDGTTGSTLMKNISELWG